MIRRRDTIPQELEDPDVPALVNPDSFADVDADNDNDNIEFTTTTNTTTLPNLSPSTSSQTSQFHSLLPQEIRNLLAGGVAGIMAKTVVAPLDRIKILFQVSTVPYHMKSLPLVANRIVQNEGVTALWKGHTATLLRVFPYSGIQFMIYDRIKILCLKQRTQKELHDTNTKLGLTPIESLVAGMVAGTMSVICTYPLGESLMMVF